ncbi:hypothetical protein X975_03945, partial [Stegodyphus mimosarum]
MPLRRCWQKWVNHGRTQCQEGSGRPRETTGREDRAIVRAALTAPDASLSSIVRATSASATIHRRLTERGLRPSRMAFATDMLRRIEDDAEFLKRIMFSDEAYFHVFGIVNRHNMRIWGSENPFEYREAQRDSPKVNVWCGLMHDRVIGPFFYTEKTVSSVVYLDMLENFVFPQLEELQPHVFLQEDGAPPH